MGRGTMMGPGWTSPDRGELVDQHWGGIWTGTTGTELARGWGLERTGTEVGRD